MDLSAENAEENQKLLAENLEKLSKEELIQKLLIAQEHTSNLRNIIKRNNKETNIQNRKQKRPFEFSKCAFRHILLKFYYLGWDYQGFVVQEDTTNTVEDYLFEALKKVCLIKDRESSNYHRCGRTDKRVSAFSQVISLNIRSKLPNGDESVENELNYCKILNRVLPENIQCYAWAPVPEKFSARFNCTARTYRYFFPRGNLNIDLMKIGCKSLIGTHDFRNLCKMDVGNGVLNYIRNISEADITVFSASDIDKSYDMLQLIIKGNAFLWHQIRCIVAVLFLMGQEKENADIITELLNIEKNPRRPWYHLAKDIPLNLFNCEYEDVQNWIYNEEALSSVISTLQKQWTLSQIQSSMMHAMLNELKNVFKVNFNSNVSNNCMTDCLTLAKKPKNYKPVMERLKCQSLEEKKEYFEKKRSGKKRKTCEENTEDGESSQDKNLV